VVAVVVVVVGELKNENMKAQMGGMLVDIREKKKKV
jgi:hypothetical protein